MLTIAEPRDRSTVSPPRRRGGRRPGQRTADRVTVIVVRPRCPRCGSTVRAAKSYRLRHRLQVQQAPDGEPATHVLIHHCRCGSCGLDRTDRSYHYEPHGAAIAGRAQ